MAQFDRDEFAADRIRNMTAEGIDRATGMSLAPTEGWEQVAEDIRTALIGAYQDGVVNPRYATDHAHELADGLVPSGPGDRLTEFTIIGSAQKATLDNPEDPEDGIVVATYPTKIMDVIAACLHKAYEDGIAALITSVEAEVDTAEAEHEEEEEEEEEEVPSNVIVVGIPAGWWATWHGGEYITIYNTEEDAKADARGYPAKAVHALNTTGDEIGDDREAYVTAELTRWHEDEGADFIANGYANGC